MLTAGFKTQDDRWVARRVLVARSFRERWLGLLRKKTLHTDEGLLLSPGASIHTFGMRFPIDALFLNGQLKILELAQDIPPWRVRLAPSRTKHVLELPAGRVHALGLKSNTYICLAPASVQARLPVTEPSEGSAMGARNSDRTQQAALAASAGTRAGLRQRHTQVELE